MSGEGKADEPNVEQLVSQVINSLVFFEEFVFAKTKFTPTTGTQVEFADAVVLLDDVLLVMQIKERSSDAAVDSAAELNWFNRKVVKAATSQIRDTLGFLEAQNEIRLPNERGRIFNLASDRHREVIKFVIYRASGGLPQDCRNKKFHRSETAGFIHLIEADDYLNVARLLRVPEEMIRYFRYRELMLTKFPDECLALPEASLAGGYVGDNDEQPPTFESFANLHRLVPDDDTWDISTYLRSLREHMSDPDFNNDYYQILNEFVRLPRSAWREFKTRLVLCIEKAAKDEFALPYRFAFPDRDIGFMLFAPDSGVTRRDDWPEHRQKGLINFTYLHKFDQKLGKCIGVQVAKDDKIFDIQWCMIVEEWRDNPELRAKLDADYPFRPVATQSLFSYFLTDQ